MLRYVRSPIARPPSSLIETPSALHSRYFQAADPRSFALPLTAGASRAAANAARALAQRGERHCHGAAMCAAWSRGLAVLRHHMAALGAGEEIDEVAEVDGGERSPRSPAWRRACAVMAAENASRRCSRSLMVTVNIVVGTLHFEMCRTSETLCGFGCFGVLCFGFVYRFWTEGARWWPCLSTCSRPPWAAIWLFSTSYAYATELNTARQYLAATAFVLRTCHHQVATAGRGARRDRAMGTRSESGPPAARSQQAFLQRIKPRLSPSHSSEGRRTRCDDECARRCSIAWRAAPL